MNELQILHLHIKCFYMYSMNTFLHSRDLFKQSKSVCELNGWDIQHVTVES